MELLRKLWSEFIEALGELTSTEHKKEPGILTDPDKAIVIGKLFNIDNKKQ